MSNVDNNMANGGDTRDSRRVDVKLLAFYHCQ
jgi:hypothetical protein